MGERGASDSQARKCKVAARDTRHQRAPTGAVASSPRAGVTSDSQTRDPLVAPSRQHFGPVATSDAADKKVPFRQRHAPDKYSLTIALRPRTQNMSSPPPNTTNGSARRPSAASRFPTAPAVVTMNGHFASVGEAPSKEQYEHGIQVIDEEKEFKYATGWTESCIGTKMAL